MISAFLFIVGLVVGFGVGILVGRKNKKGVEKLVAEAKARIAELEAKIKAQ